MRAAGACLILFFAAAGAFAAVNKCPALTPPPAEHARLVASNTAELIQAVANADSNTTIFLSSGIYELSQTLRFTRPNVVLRSQSGQPSDVVLDGGYREGSIVEIYASHVTIADITLKHARYHAVHLQGGGHYALLYNLKIVDGREQFIKANPSGGNYTDHGQLACSELELTAAGREYIESHPTPGFLCYTGGIDAHQAWGWTVRDNTFRGIYCTNGGLAEHAIHFWRTSRGTNVERNTILHCARGIGFGLGSEGSHRLYSPDPTAGTGVTAGHIDGTIKNNFIYAAIGDYYDSGISLEQAWRAKVEHNTIYSAAGSYNVAIDSRYQFTNALLRNNLYYPRLNTRNGAAPILSHNIQAEPSMFVNLVQGDLHLVEGAESVIDEGSAETEVADDIDGGRRDDSPDVGADEFGSNGDDSPVPAAPNNLRFR